MTVKLLTEDHLELLSLNGGCRGLSVSTLSLVKYYHAAAHLFIHILPVHCVAHESVLSIIGTEIK